MFTYCFYSLQLISINSLEISKHPGIRMERQSQRSVIADFQNTCFKVLQEMQMSQVDSL